MKQTKSKENVEEHPGHLLYNTQIRPVVETSENIGKFCIVDPQTGDYEVDADSIAASARLRVRHPGLIYWAERIGYRSCASFGSFDSRVRKK